MTAIIALLVLCGIADCVTTRIGLKYGASEGNPIAAPVLKLLGPTLGILLLKLACTATIIVVLVLQPSWWWLGVLFLAGYAVVLWNNVRVIRSL